MVSNAAPCELQQQGVLSIKSATAGPSYELAATVVWQSPDAATVGLQFDSWQAERAAQLQAFVLSPVRKRAPSLYERIRALMLSEQHILARTGTQAERVALERCYGSVVWESLLQNPQLSSPEVAAIAKKAGLPRPLLGLIAANASWLSVPEVQRALLANPRLDASAVPRVLKAMSRADLQLVPQQTRYSAQIRQHAKRLMNG